MVKLISISVLRPRVITLIKTICAHSLRIAVSQITAIVTLYTIFFMKRCLEGQIIACIRSNEMAARLQREAMENKWSIETFKTKNHESIILLYIQRSQESPTFHSICRGPEIPPTNRSMIARFRMSRYERRR